MQMLAPLLKLSPSRTQQLLRLLQPLKLMCLAIVARMVQLLSTLQLVVLVDILIIGRQETQQETEQLLLLD